MSEKTVIILPYKLHLRHLLFALAKRMSITALVPPEKSIPDSVGVRSIPIYYRQFGMGIFANWIGPETRTLKYVVGLSRLLAKENIEAMVTFEYYHWYTFQTIFFKKKHKEFRLFVFCETKRWPRNIFSRTVKKILMLIFKANLRYVDCIFVYTEATREFLSHYLPVTKIHLLPAPTNVELFRPQEGKLFIQDGMLRLMMNARYAEYKRHKDLFEAVSKLKKSGKDIRLTCIGRAEIGKEKIVALANSMGLAETVTFLDPVPNEEMSELYHKHDVLVLPSYNEAIGMVVPEAMACGIPTITSDTVGANVYVKEEETGFIFKTGDVSALVVLLEGCFDAVKLQKMGINASKHIIKNFTPDQIAVDFINKTGHSTA